MSEVQTGWDANAPTDAVVDYVLSRADGTGALFGTASPIFTGTDLSFLDTAVSGGLSYTYFLQAQNVVGLSPPTTGVSVTTLGPVPAHATEFIAAGALVNAFTSGGSGFVQNANATDATRPANGFVTAIAASGVMAPVFPPGQLNAAMTGLTPGTNLWLDVNPGLTVTTPPTGVGNVQQQVGQSTDTNTMIFFPQPGVLL